MGLNSIATYGMAVAARSRQMSLAPLWWTAAGVTIAAAWLLPNHAQPWLAFHSDAWMAVALALVGGAVLLHTRGVALSWMELLVLLAAGLPFLHLALGLLPFAGQAWIAAAYLLGFGLAIVIGRQWHSWRPAVMGNVVFGSFFLASVVSVGLQLYQWAGLTADRGLFDIWVISVAQDRPYANIAQPNQLATLLLWGVLACAWGVHRGYLGRAAAMIASAWLVTGLALTQSRTGFLGLCLVAAAGCFWRPLVMERRRRLFYAALVPLYFLALAAVEAGAAGLLLDRPLSIAVRSVSEVRPTLWHMLLQAAAQRPWLGFGWNEVLAAHLALAEKYPGLTSLFAHAHNLVLDLVIWAGIPIGLALSAACLAWVWTAARRVQCAAHALWLLVILTIGIHAMLELPLHYAYFLLPAGLAIGALSGDLAIWPVAGVPPLSAWRCVVVAFVAAALLLAAIVDDYFRVEAATVDVRLKMARLRMDTPPRPPEVRLLTQFASVLDLSLLEPATGVGEDRLRRARDVTALVITYRNLSQLPVLLALNGHVPEARCWMAKATVLVGGDSKPLLLSDWSDFQGKYPQLKGIQWPAAGEAERVCAPVRDSRLGPWPQLVW